MLFPIAYSYNILMCVHIFVCIWCSFRLWFLPPLVYGLFGLSMAVISSALVLETQHDRIVDIRLSFCLALPRSISYSFPMHACVFVRARKNGENDATVYACTQAHSLTRTHTHPHNVFSRGNAPFQSQQTFTKIIYLSSLYPFKWPKLFRCLHLNYTHTEFACLSTLFVKETQTTMPLPSWLNNVCAFSLARLKTVIIK